MEKIKTAIVISGGGAFGACSVGTLCRLNKTYDVVAGVSTGALMAPMVALKKWDVLKEAYTSVTQDDIFSNNPFKTNGKFNISKALFRFIQGKETLGETHALRKTIDRFMDEKDFHALAAYKKKVILALLQTNVRPAKIRYFNNLMQGMSFKDYGDYMWGAANAPVACSILKKNGAEFTDAGVLELLSLCEVIESENCKQIDVFIHRPLVEGEEKIGDTLDLFHNAARLYTSMRHEVERGDLDEGLKLARIYGCQVRVYYLPRKLADNSLIFDKKLMQQWWQLGYDTAFDKQRIKEFDFSVGQLS